MPESRPLRAPSPRRPANGQHRSKLWTRLLAVARGRRMPRRPGRPKAPSPGRPPIRAPRILMGLEMTARRAPTVRSAMTRSAATAQLMSTPRTTLTAGTAWSARRPRMRAGLLSRPRTRRRRWVHRPRQGRRAGPAHLVWPPPRARRARRVSLVSRTSPGRRPQWIRLAPVRRAHRVPMDRRPRVGRVRPVPRVRPAGPERPAGLVPRLSRAGRQRLVRQARAVRQRAVRQRRPHRRLLRVPQAGRVSRARPRHRAREKTRPRIVTGGLGRRRIIAMLRPTGEG